MNPPQHILARMTEHRPIRIGIIAKDKLSAIFLNQIKCEPRLHLLGIADADPQRAVASLRLAGWPDDAFAAASFDGAFKHGNACVTDDMGALIANPYIDVIIAFTAGQANDTSHVNPAPDPRHLKSLIVVDANTDFGAVNFTHLLKLIGV